MKRDLSVIICKLIEIIPSHLKDDDVGICPRRGKYQRLVDSLEKILYDAMYTAPEDMGRHWRSVAELLGQELGKPDTDWKIKASKLMQGEIE